MILLVPSIVLVPGRIIGMGAEVRVKGIISSIRREIYYLQYEGDYIIMIRLLCVFTK